LPGYTEVVKDDGDCKIDRKCGVNPKEAEVVLDPIPGMPTGDFVYNPETGKWENPKTGEVVDAPGIELKDIYYDFDKWYIREESERELNKLLGFLQENSDA
jgi:hypothetical protein